MSAVRKVLFSPQEIYHVFNRGVEKRIVFNDKNDYVGCLNRLSYYRYNSPLSFSKYSELTVSRRKNYEGAHFTSENKTIEIYSYSLMPNHFHLLLKELCENGISKFISDFTNSYTKYFNIKNQRVGPLFQGTFKAVHVEDDGQLIQVCKYIHRNPVKSLLVKEEELIKYPWTSFFEYFNNSPENLCDTNEILSYFSSKDEFLKFTLDKTFLPKKLPNIEHLLLDS